MEVMRSTAPFRRSAHRQLQDTWLFLLPTLLPLQLQRGPLAVDLQVFGTVLRTWGLCPDPVPVSDLPALSSQTVT